VGNEPAMQIPSGIVAKSRQRRRRDPSIEGFTPLT
jgi:hypothetical protein